MPASTPVPLELHVSRRARDRYRIEEAFLSQDGHAIFPNFHAARLFARQLNARRDLARVPEQAVSPGELNAMGLIVEILHYVIALYREQVNPGVMADAATALDRDLGRDALDGVLARFVDEFPPRDVYLRRIEPAAWITGESHGVPHRLVLLEELMMLWLQNINPAFGPLLDLFDDAELERATAYCDVFARLAIWFADHPPFGPESQSLLEMLQAPARAVPHSLSGQLEFIRERWGHLLGDRLWRLLSGLDLLREERRWREWSAGGRAPTATEVLRFDRTAPGDSDAESEHYSPDLDWMPRLVLIAKSVHVWLDQLSKRYGRPLTLLSDIPDSELDRLARWGFTGLWLIGVWERSNASQRIKRLCGNPDAVASAYSLHDYTVAADLGGEPALLDLRERAWRRGIRLAGDMVPNHVGIDGQWVREHPDWFVRLDQPPFPAYSFNGPNLSSDGRMEIFLEDHYYDRTDAAVTFKRVDRENGSVSYIYHGNDGTGMPWNDTAQLDYLNPAVREAVARTILHTASLFPIIRFDAAMTLTKRHFHRLWFPQPGAGGDIPSRAGHGLTREQFDAAMQTEFWRDVVERVAREAPDTLLLAEAFWLMEGFFVRTLGMHRVYNSAFMNMLKMEENAKYRQTLRNVLEFDPEILKRFVNFMNNPDEETAIAQFGDGDKYFGVCLLLATLPGLPMFGHGQVEGFTEKYGMEYRRAYRDEQPNEELVRRHEHEICPLLHRRRLFAGVENFLLYDFHAPDGAVNEDVFAYSNREGDERALVVYHNRFASTAGWIRLSTPVALRAGDGRSLTRRALGEGLGLDPGPGRFVIFRDHVGELEFVRAGADLHAQGIFVELEAYSRHVFLDFREVRDSRAQPYAELCAFLGGRGVPSVAEALQQICLQPVHAPLRALLGMEGLGRLLPPAQAAPSPPDAAALDAIEVLLREFLGRARDHAAVAASDTPAAVAARARRTLEIIVARAASATRSAATPASTSHAPPSVPAGPTPTRAPATLNPAAVTTSGGGSPRDVSRDALLATWALLRDLGRVTAAGDAAEVARSRLDEWQLGRLVAAALVERGESGEAAWRAVGWLRALIAHQSWFASTEPRAVLADLFRDETVRQLLGVNRWQGVLWLDAEAFAELLTWLREVAEVDLDLDGPPAKTRRAAEAARREKLLANLQTAGERSGWRVEELLGPA